MINSGTARVIISRGARATEDRLLAEIDRLAPRSAHDLGPPIRVVVPSRSLRRHLLQAIARRFGSVAGLEVQTLFAFARAAVVADERTPPGEDAAFEVLVRRLAAEDPGFRAELEPLTDGYDSVLGAVRDLLDAGFDKGNREAVTECLEELGDQVAPERLDRSRSLVRLATKVLERAAAEGVGRSVDVLRMAEEALDDPENEMVRARHLFIHGFADVTGIAADLLKKMARVFGGSILLDRPPDPARPDRVDLGAVFLGRLDETLSHFDHEEDPEILEEPMIELCEAPDAEAEVRWVAERVKDLLEGGLPAVEIGVVGRAMDGRITTLRRHFRRLGVPFSGEGLTVPGARPRRGLERLLEILQKGENAEIDLWLETWGGRRGTTELLLGLRVVGLSRLTDVAEMTPSSLPSDGVRLPLEIGADSEDGQPSDRRLAVGVFRDARERAKRLLGALRRRPERADAGRHGQVTTRVLDALGWEPESVEHHAVRRAVIEIAASVPDDFKLTASEWLRLLTDGLSRAGGLPVGGRGGGVRVLTVIEARARTFGHLFIVGLQRGVFPRVASEDPMLPEAVRLRLAGPVLPEMPVKGRSADEERYLFAQLVSSAPAVSLSWHLFGDKGTLTPSPFVERLQLRAGIKPPEKAASLWPAEDPPERTRTSYELSVSEAKNTPSFEAVLEAAVEEGRSDWGLPAAGVPAATVAAARCRVLEVAEAEEGSPEPSVWFGFCGGGEVRTGERTWVTRLEGIGTCPWRAFVERRLRVQPLVDPLAGMPRIDGLLVGMVVHGVLEAIVADAIGRHDELDDVVGRSPEAVVWPGERRLGELIAAQARRVTVRAGLAAFGLEPLIGARAVRVLDRARELEWVGGRLVGVLGAEVTGETGGGGIADPVAFRADRVDAAGNTVVFVDYKVSTPAVTAKTEPTRGTNLRTLIARGRLLQAAAYSHASGVATGRGRYVYLKPGDWADEICELVVDGDDEELAAVFARAVSTIQEADRLGIAFPRVAEADGKAARHCEYCGVAEACRRDDSSFRRHLVDWMNASDADDQPAEVTVSRALWWLGSDPTGSGP